MRVKLSSLIGRLNETMRAAMEGAAGLCLSRTHYDVEIEHVLLKLLDVTDSDVSLLLKHAGMDRSRFASELTRSLDRLKRGNARTPTFSPTLIRMLTEAWSIGSIDHAATRVRSGFCWLALASDPELSRLIREVSREFHAVVPETLSNRFEEWTAESVEARQAQSEPGIPGAGPRPVGGKTPCLDQYTSDLTANARAGQLDPVLGRNAEIRQIVDILTRRRQNNPILVGEAGVGKTAIVEGFALRLAAGDAPAPLRGVSIRALDMALLQAGAGVKGEFENRLKGLVQEVKQSETPIILFIDEAHTMIGAGGAAGQNDAANILKPALARGELRTIAATTWSEYKKYFEKDAALARRFQPVKVGEPTEAQCMVMLRGTVSALEKHHGVRILDEGVESAVRLSHRYIADRQLPDKAVSVLDTACARLALGQNTVPPAIEDAHRTLDDLETQVRVLEREAALGADHSQRLEESARDKARVQESLSALEGRWQTERSQVSRIREVREAIEKAPVGLQEVAGWRSELAGLAADLETLQGEQPLIRVCVDAQVVGEVVAGWTGIPIGRLLKDEIETILNLESRLEARVIGQSHALRAISQRIRTSRANLDDPGKPVGVFLLVGPSGVGKTETALALSELLYGGERNLITLNMSEFQEAHTVSTLKGSPPGYVGYGEGGVLTEAVRRRPYSVVLLDEVEKAHPDVLELFFQVFDKGMMEDGEGREIDFKNTIIILTSNAGTESIMNMTADPETMPSPEGLVKALKPELDKIFKPAFLGRLVTIAYHPVRDEALRQIIRLKLGKIERRLAENHRTRLAYSDGLLGEVARRCTEVESGARNIDNILTNTLLPEVSRIILSGMAEGAAPAAIQVGVGENGAFTYIVQDAAAGAAAG